MQEANKELEELLTSSWRLKKDKDKEESGHSVERHWERGGVDGLTLSSLHLLDTPNLLGSVLPLLPELSGSLLDLGGESRL